MNQSGDGTTLELDSLTAHLLQLLGEIWSVPKEVAIRRVMEDSNAAIGTGDKEIPLTEREVVFVTRLLMLLDEKVKMPLTEQEIDLLKRHLEGYTPAEIAGELGEDVRRTRFDLLTVLGKVRYRLKAKERTTTSDRLQTFMELQRRLGLTSAKATEWRNEIREARR